MTTLNVTVRSKKDAFEGTVTIPGLQTIKLVNKEGKTLFSNTSSLKNVARSVGKRLGMEVTYVEPAKATKKPVKKVTKTKTTCCQTTECCNS
jgi:hypothetical protein